MKFDLRSLLKFHEQSPSRISSLLVIMKKCVVILSLLLFYFFLKKEELFLECLSQRLEGFLHSFSGYIMSTSMWFQYLFMSKLYAWAVVSVAFLFWLMHLSSHNPVFSWLSILKLWMSLHSMQTFFGWTSWLNRFMYASQFSSISKSLPECVCGAAWFYDHVRDVYFHLW